MLIYCRQSYTKFLIRILRLSQKFLVQKFPTIDLWLTQIHTCMYVRAWPMLVQETATKGHFNSATVSHWLGMQLLTLFLSLRTAASDPVALWTADSMNSMSTVSSALVRVTTLVFSVACNRFVMADQSLMAWVACHKLSTKNTPCSWICGIQNSEQG